MSSTYYQNVTKSRTKWLQIAVAAGAAIALTAGIAARSFAVSDVLVTPTDTQGWTTAAPADNRPGGSVTFTNEFSAPAGYGAGSLKLETTDGSAKAQYYQAIDDVQLADVTDIAYSTYRPEGSLANVNQLPALNLVIDYNGSADGGFSTLVFEPVYQSGGVAAIQNDTWQPWDASADAIWWSTKVMPGIETAFESYVSLNSIIAANPDAVVRALIVNQGSGNPALTSGVDAVTFNGTTYNFELPAPDTSAPDVTIASPTTGALVQGDATLAATIADDQELLRYYYFVRSSDGTNVVGPTTVNTSEELVNFTKTVDTTSWADGTYTFQVEARDAANNKDAGSVAKATFTVNNVVDTKEQCKVNGWATLRTTEGATFKNQGQCVAYVVSSDNSAVRQR